jgi:hypothetical protein
MAGEGAFPFLRATYWRWAERIPAIAGDLAAAPRVLAVGDVHLENFGTWRDADGRLVWGVNDYDEAAEMPYALDLLRLATSALLACPHGGEPDAARISWDILQGYREGLEDPEPLVLDRRLEWLRKLVIVPEDERDGFWGKLEKKRKRFLARPEAERPALWPRYREALRAALPAGSGEPEMWYRSAGLGSLGRPRWVARARWCGDWVIREAKAVVPSAWTRVEGEGAGRSAARRSPRAGTARPTRGTASRTASPSGACRRTTARSAPTRRSTPRTRAGRRGSWAGTCCWARGCWKRWAGSWRRSTSAPGTWAPPSGRIWHPR